MSKICLYYCFFPECSFSLDYLVTPPPWNFLALSHSSVSIENTRILNLSPQPFSWTHLLTFLAPPVLHHLPEIKDVVYFIFVSPAYRPKQAHAGNYAVEVTVEMIVLSYTVLVRQCRGLCLALGASWRRTWKTDVYSEENNSKQCHESNSSLGPMYRMTGKRDLVLI